MLIILKKKQKTYPFTPIGYAQMQLDVKMKKQEKINNVTSTILLLVFLAFGLLSKEFLILYFTGKGIEFVTNLFI